jgi:aryl-alcohol dehydrogenase-like predicted oxidoreductase
MQTRPLGRTGVAVPPVCLGTMTWGRQNTEAEGHAQMDYAIDCGLGFWDTAEMYAVPPTAETYGRTEAIIGNWFRARGRRHEVFLATKLVGPGTAFSYIRDGKSWLDARNIRAALDASLTRLRTDYVDLYQTHWPNRQTNSFGRLGYVHDPDEHYLPPEETLAALADEVKAGRIRHVGLSNESPWGLMRAVAGARAAGLACIASIQNPYSLLNRTFEIGLAECAIREQVALLAYSPLAGGTLTGKYLDGRMPAGTRRAIDHRRSRYAGERADAATGRYVALARDHGLDPAQMAIAYAVSQPFVTSVIIGATSMEQLRVDIDGASLALSPEILAGIEAIHATIPNPCP